MNKKIKDVTEFIASDMRLIALAVKNVCTHGKEQNAQKDEISEKDLSEITIS